MEDEKSICRVVWTELAIADLDALTRFIASDNPVAAERMGRGTLEHAQLLARFPFIGPVHPQGSKGPVREIVFRRTYRIFYSVNEPARTASVLRVWHGARGEPQLPA